jgi:hypothetical protein
VTIHAQKESSPIPYLLPSLPKHEQPQISTHVIIDREIKAMCISQCQSQMQRTGQLHFKKDCEEKIAMGKWARRSPEFGAGRAKLIISR